MKEWKLNLDRLFDNIEEMVEVNNEKIHANVRFIGNLENGHTKTVNVVRFSRSG